MKLSDAKLNFEAGYFDLVEIRKSPGNISEYIALLYGRDGKSYMLCNEQDVVVSSRQLEHLVMMLKEVGIRKAKIYF